jgi:hypothetical protein
MRESQQMRERIHKDVIDKVEGKRRELVEDAEL